MNIEQQESDVIDKNKIYLVERIVDHRIRNGTTEYLVSWQGYPEEQNTWEPPQNLDCPDLLHEYETNVVKHVRYMDSDPPSLLIKSNNYNDKSGIFQPQQHQIIDDKSLLLNSIRQQVSIFSGIENAQQWFSKIDSQFAEYNVSFQDRLDIIPYFFTCDAMIWYSLTKEKFFCYTDFCRIFAIKYFKSEQISNHDLNEQQCLHSQSSSSTMTKHLTTAGPDCLDDLTPSVDRHVNTTPDLNSNSNNVSTSILSNTISKALIDKFIKQPFIFRDQRDDILKWLHDVEQQFNIMNLSDIDKLNLAQICLKDEAYQWFQRRRSQLTSWHIFTKELIKSFTSNLQRDLAFKKLKNYQQTIHQSATQYYTEMMHLIQQADPQMNESTKVHYLMNGLLPSLLIETRRNYPTTTQEFLTQVKVAEELTAVNNNLASISIGYDATASQDSSSSLPPSSTNPTTTPTNNFKNYVHDNYYKSYNTMNKTSFNNGNSQRYLSRIIQKSAHGSPDYNQSSYLPDHTSSYKSSSTGNSPSSHQNKFSHNHNRYQNKNYEYSNVKNRDSSYRCFKCGSPDHLVRQCQHFQQRSQ